MDEPRVFLRHKAEEDLSVAAGWYDEQVPSLGREFLQDAAATIERIVAMPGSYQVIEKDVRRALMRRFPFGIYFSFDDARIQVLAVLHQARDPRRRPG